MPNCCSLFLYDNWIFYILLLVACGGGKSVDFQRITKSINKVLKILVYTNLVYVFVAVIFHVPTSTSFRYYLTLQWIYSFIMLGNGVADHLWYLMSLVQVLVLYWIALRINRLTWFYTLGLVGFVGGMMIGIYSGVEKIPYDIALQRNVLTIGLPAFICGMLLKKYSFYKMVRLRALLILILSCVVLLYVENNIWKNVLSVYARDLYFVNLPLGMLIFSLFVKIGQKNNAGSILTVIGKKMSLDIYLWHPMVSWCLNRAILKWEANPIAEILSDDLMIFFITLLSSLAIATIISNFRNSKGRKFKLSFIEINVVGRN